MAVQQNGSMESIAALSSRIASKTDSGEVVTTELSTSQRIIARLTDGIYREPWAAFRELIANAYDADATACFRGDGTVYNPAGQLRIPMLRDRLPRRDDVCQSLGITP